MKMNKIEEKSFLGGNIRCKYWNACGSSDNCRRCPEMKKRRRQK